MKVLIVGSGDACTLELSYLRALRALGCTTEFSDTRLDLHLSSLPRRARFGLGVALDGMRSRVARVRLSRRLRESRGQFDAVVIFKGSDFSLPVLERLRSAWPRLTWVNINPDNPLSTLSGSSNHRIRSSIPFYDLYVTWTPLLVPALTTVGGRRVVSIPFGHDNWASSPARSDTGQQRVVFVGTWDRQRESVLAELRDLPLRIYGESWSRVSARSPLADKIEARNVWGEELRSLYSSAGVCLNLLRPQNRESHNMRTFEIPASGGVMLTGRTREQCNFFPEGQACLMYDSVAEMRERAQVALAAPDSNDRLRVAAVECSRAHSYTSRARHLLSLLGR